MLSIILFIIGFAMLVKGADWLVDGSSALARRFKISPLVIGLTVVALGTSLPELVVNIFASVSGSGDLAFGNIVGSNIANILLILGISAAIFPLTVTHGTIWREIPFSLMAILVLFLLANDKLIDGLGYSAVTRIDGFILLSFFILFLYYMIGTARSSNQLSTERGSYTVSLGHDILFIVIGITALVLGGKFVVDGGIFIARYLGMSEAVIGLTIIAVGTSLPELVTSAVAAYKKNPEIAIGNVVGSNIMNIFLILGISGVIRPLQAPAKGNSDIGVAVGATFLLFLWMFVGRRHEIERWQGYAFIGSYVVYTAWLLIGHG